MSDNRGIYGRYKKVRDAVWDIYVRYNITSLPVSVMELCTAMGITFISYKNGWQDIIDLGLERECIERNAFAVHFADEDRWCIFYHCQTIPRATIRYYLAHELGHIILGHEMETANIKNRNFKFSRRNPVQTWNDVFEKDAHMFAVRLLAPAGPLATLNIREARDIEYLCGLPLDAAVDRAKRMEELSQRDKFGMDKREKQIIEVFQSFASSYHLKKY